jgi:hypothetical protein
MRFLATNGDYNSAIFVTDLVATMRRSEIASQVTRPEEELRRSCPWWWLHCRNPDNPHHRAVPLVPYIIQWGPDASTNLLRHWVLREVQAEGR